MKRLLLIVLPLLLIVGCSEVEGQQQQLIPQITETYKNGGIKSITYHKKTQNGIEIVKKEEYWRNGQKEERNYKDGKYDGLFITWYKNGQKNSEVIYKDGEKDGLETRWNDNGQKYWKGTYKDGERISLKRWNRDGSVME